MKLLKFLTFFMILGALTNAQTKWVFDKSHSEIGFTVTHLLISEVDGKFNNYEGSITTNGDNLEEMNINFEVDVNSINTDNPKRDEHLRSDDFFNAEQFPKMVFKSTSMKKIKDNHYKLKGDLTIRDVTKQVELDVKYNGSVKDPWGNTKAGFKITGVLNRFDYNLKWNSLMETGGAVVGKEVELKLNVQLKKES